MLYTALFTLVATVQVAFALDVQVPLSLGQPDEHPSAILDSDNLIGEWNIDKLPNPNATDHLVFETAHALLQHWPNTRMRNGHNVVPGTIPKGTLLYHGRTDKNLPTGPEWTATDPEHSYVFCRDIFNPKHDAECWQLTLMTTRPLKVVYFDGSSSAKLPYGSFDTQELIVWGKLSNGDLFEDEARRIQALCRWGKKFGVDGIVRMQTDFEVMLCSFTAGVSVVSFANLVSGWTSNRIVPQFNQFEIIRASSWHYHFPGETRIQLDLSGLVSFYDTQLAPSLVPIRAGQERWDHRAANISSGDLAAIKSRLEANLIRPEAASSGIDWKTLIQVIVDRFAQRLELTRYLLNSPAIDSAGILDLAKKAQSQLRIMLTPYILFSATPNGRPEEARLDWANPIYNLCATTHTHLMESRFNSMTDSEKLLLRAVRATSKEICRTVTKMWATGVYAGIDSLLDAKEYPDISKVTHLRAAWAKDLDRLMEWLDWHVWVKCNSSCGPEEMCYLPTWPMGFPWLAKFPNTAPLPDEPVTPDWIRPQPKCIRQVEPFTF